MFSRIPGLSSLDVSSYYHPQSYQSNMSPDNAKCTWGEKLPPTEKLKNTIIPHLVNFNGYSKAKLWVVASMLCVRRRKGW